jgi:hypothetical protein
MAIKYALVKNHLTGNGDYRALIHHARVAGMDEVVDRIVGQGSTVTRADIYSVLEGYHTAIEHMLLEGTKVNTPLANYGVSIRGVFEEYRERFDAARHTITATISVGRRLRRTIRRRGKPVREPPNRPVPQPLTYADFNSGEWDGVLTPGGVGQVIGYGLKFDPGDPEQGIFFVAADGQAARVSVVAQNDPRRLVFQVPAGLAPGTYTLQVRAAFAEGDVRSGKLTVSLEV